MLPQAFALAAIVAMPALAQKAPDYAKFADEARTAVARIAIDPASAQFRDLFVSVTPNPAEEGRMRWALCGEMNAKNRYGGYVGFQRFIAYRMPGAPFEVVTGDLVETFWGATCASVTRKL